MAGHWVDEVRDWSEARGYCLAFGSPEALRAAEADIEARLNRGELDRRFYHRTLRWVGLGDRPDWWKSGTLVVLAVPRAAHRLTFTLPGGTFKAVVPPTYHDYRALFAAVRDDLTTGPLPGDTRLATLSSPLKNLAARLGLVAYGRNNVTYLPGRGSYHQLVGFVVDEPPRRAEAGIAAAAEPAMLPACGRCRVCARACPTGAISEDRFLLHGERCLTFLNEGPGEWPAWVPPSAHKCFIGCLACQEACPENRGRLKYVDLEPAFDEEETAVILAGGSRREAGRRETWAAIRAKLKELGLPGDGKQISRNLRACLEAQGLTGQDRARAGAGSTVA